ncbi:histidine kinase dimerization/phosphoacceptor domain -containing protein [Methanobacterium oryzae]|uniref:histidine kinase dimerization/phosphoacceptor domain -containing protein n=1 Tax=Methanobacterium oryzae TaxID=69540 RepID=UPI003D242936
MNIYAMISLLSSILCLFLGNFIFYKNPKNRINQLVALLSFLLAYLLFVEFGYRQAETYYIANLWFIASFIWALTSSLILHTVLIITGRTNLTENKIFISLLYIPSIILTILDLNNKLMHTSMVKEYWGWTYAIQVNSTFYYLSNFWITLLFAVSIILSYDYYRKSEDREKKLAKYIFLALAFIMISGLTTDCLLPALSIRIPELYYTIGALGMAILCYGIIKYRIPPLAPSVVADEIVSTMSNFLVLIDEKMRIKNVNSEGLSLLGYDESEIYGKSTKTIFPEDLDLSKTYKENYPSNFETVIKTKEGKSILVLMSITPIIHKSQKLGVLCIGSDITRLKQEELNRRLLAEQTIKRQEILLDLSRKDLANLSEVMKMFTEISSKTLNVDRVSIWLFNQDKTKIICKDLYNLKTDCHEQDSIVEAVQYPRYFNAIKRSHNLAINDARIHNDTSEFNESYFKPKGIFSVMDIPIWLDGELKGIVCHESLKIREWKFEDQDFASSIAYLISLGLEASERRKVEKKLRASLDEKELLMKEIHHRVKNNLTVISSLLNLQSRYINDKETLDIFRESQNRAISMALIHEKLYQSADLRKITFGDYLRSLTEQLFYSYNISPGINLSMEIEDLDVDINTSVPLALIVNEIVSNSLKHAFEGQKAGNISVKFYKKSDEYELIIEDDGIGFPDNLNFRNVDSLGMQIVNSLTRQINGKITLDKSNSTRFTINFKEKSYL